MECIILVGGLGTRLRSSVNNLPKAMAPVAGSPFLFYIFKNLESHGISHIILSTGYRHEVIEEWVDSQKWNFRISHSVEDSPLDTGGAIKKALEKTKDDNVLVINGDTFFDIPLKQFYHKHFSCGSPISIALKPMADFSRYGNVIRNGSGKIMKFCEKSYCKKGYINAGIYCINKKTSIFGRHNGKFSFETEILEKGYIDISGFEYDGYFIDIGIPEDYKKANIDFENIFR